MPMLPWSRHIDRSLEWMMRAAGPPNLRNLSFLHLTVFPNKTYEVIWIRRFVRNNYWIKSFLDVKKGET